MKEAIEKAKEELKRVDHLFYVSLKYTKTVDVIKSVIVRLINVFEFSIDSLLLYMQNKKKIKEIPTNPITKSIEVRKLFEDDAQLLEDIDLYLLLRRINRAEYTSAREFRKHVTMTATVDGKKMDITIETIQEYFERAKSFVERTNKLIHNIKDE
ncbi:hypothetical protein CEE44_01610 [Candidatus Woesearchaeota archaeon B3_Woes]|nr:MAG: hypothetical protein CEE44_01610 [Candidatus Woesearchaeota archaeon B3_Woes]